MSRRGRTRKIKYRFLAHSKTLFSLFLSLSHNSPAARDGMCCHQSIDSISAAHAWLNLSPIVYLLKSWINGKKGVIPPSKGSWNLLIMLCGWLICKSWGHRIVRGRYSFSVPLRVKSSNRPLGNFREIQSQSRVFQEVLFLPGMIKKWDGWRAWEPHVHST